MNDPFFYNLIWAFDPNPISGALYNCAPLNNSFSLGISYAYAPVTTVPDAVINRGMYALLNPSNYVKLTGLPTPTTYTFDCWFKSSAYSNTYNTDIGGNAGTGGSYYCGFLLEAEKSTCLPVVKMYRNQSVNSPELTIKGSTPLPVNTLVHLAVVVAGTAVRLYVDGVLAASGTLASAIVPQSQMYFGYIPGYPTAGGPTYYVSMRYTAAERYTTNFTPSIDALDRAESVAIPIGISGANPIRANKETVAQSAPFSAGISQYFTDLKSKPSNAFKINQSADLIKIPSRSVLGFIRGVVTRKGQIAAGQHVVCLNSRFNLVAETISAADGSYRFDSLSIYDTYIVLAQDNWDFKYAPVGADRRTPEAYT